MDNLESFINEQFEKREKIDAKQDNNELKNTIKDILKSRAVTKVFFIINAE